ncbi:hypothetical protein ACTQ0H_08735 [Collinsella sp. LCP21S3_A3]|uniref:hypothetical protein n=1 Tax=unclassified Collinsella TaxID=2637548 RepID=UPI003F8E3919
MISPICWFAAFLVALVALCYSIHLERHNYQHKLFGFEINSNRRIVAFGILALGAFCLFAPVTWAQCFSSDLGEGWEPGAFNFISWVITNFFAVGWTTTIQTGLTDVTSTVYSAIPLGGSVTGQVFNLLYSLLTLAYIIALPVEIGLFAFNAVATRLSGSVIKRHLKYADHAIIFESVDANTELLARDIVNNIKDGTLNNANGNGDIALIFCLGSDEDSERQRVLRNLCQGYVRYVFTDSEAADVLTTITSLRDAVKHLVAVDVVATSEETEHNVSATIDMLEATHKDPQAGCAPKITLHCLHSNPDDPRVFDAIKPYPKNVNLHLVSRTQNEIYNVLDEAPLFRWLAPVDITRDDSTKLQNLTVLVIGAGDYGMQAARTAYWMGRLPQVKLSIVIVDPNAHEIVEREAARYPEMLGEIKDGAPTVRFVEASAPSITLDRLMAGNSVAALHYDLQSKRVACDDSCVLLPDNAFVYAFVTTGNCSQNLSCSLMLQRQIFNRFVEHGTPNYMKQRPVICPHIESEEILKALRKLAMTAASSEKEKDPIVGIMHPFGSRKAFFTYNNLLNNKLEQRAIQLNAVYEMCNYDHATVSYDASMPDDTARDKFNKSEWNKRSSRAAAAYLPSRFWSVGLSETIDTLENDYLAKLEGGRSEGLDNGHLVRQYLIEDKLAGNTLEAFANNEANYRRRIKNICLLGDIEHERWLAYCQAIGMTELGHGTREDERDQRRRAHNVNLLFKEEEPKDKPEGTNKSETLMRHAYMTPNNNVLGARGFLLGKDVYAYDRIIVALSARIAKGSIVK